MLHAAEKKLYITQEYEGFHEESDYMIRTDEQRLAQVVLCLQSNALKFTFEGGIKIKTFKLENTLKVEVEDTGIGIK